MAALDDVKTAQAELHASTYWKPGSRGWTTTHLYLCDQALQAAIRDLTVTPPVPTPPTTVYLFQDDFDGPAGAKPDPAKWDAKTYQAGDNAAYWNGMTNASLDGNGNLDIHAVKDSTGKWTSAFLSGKVSYAGPHLIEARAKVAAGNGPWSGPVWEWDYPYGAQGTENDVCEQLGAEPSQYHTTLHSAGVQSGSANSSSPYILASGFHVYAANVYPDHADYLLNGNVVRTITKTDLGGNWGFDTTPMCANVNLNIGGWGGTIDPTLSSVHLLVDYIRVSAL